MTKNRLERGARGTRHTETLDTEANGENETRNDQPVVPSQVGPPQRGRDEAQGDKHRVEDNKRDSSRDKMVADIVGKVVGTLGRDDLSDVERRRSGHVGGDSCRASRFVRGRS